VCPLCIAVHLTIQPCSHSHRFVGHCNCPGTALQVTGSCDFHMSLYLMHLLLTPGGFDSTKCQFWSHQVMGVLPFCVWLSSFPRDVTQMQRIFFFFILSGVRLSLLVLWPLTGLLYQLRMISDGDCGEIGGMKIGRGNRSTWRKPAPAPLCLPQIPHDYTRVRTWAAAVGNQQWTSWAMAQLFFNREILKCNLLKLDRFKTSSDYQLTFTCSLPVMFQT
jgi:hypothetical protein